MSEEQPHLPGTQCELCNGSGQVAVFYEEFINRDKHVRELRLMKVLQYEQLKDYHPNPDWIQFYFRCSCPRGKRRPNGTPRWEDKTYITKKI